MWQIRGIEVAAEQGTGRPDLLGPSQPPHQVCIDHSRAGQPEPSKPGSVTLPQLGKALGAFQPLGLRKVRPVAFRVDSCDSKIEISLTSFRIVIT